MNKKLNIFLISVLGISTVLVYLLIGAFLFQKGILFPEVGASPATCTVNDDLVIANPNGIGIGIDPPVEKLHITNGNFRIASGVIKSWGALDFYPDVDDTGDDYIRWFDNADNEIMRIHNNGSVGIGVDNPDALYKLEIDDDVRIRDGGLTLYDTSDGTFPAYMSLSGSIVGSKFWDADDTTYYVDPADTGTSINIAGSINNIRGFDIVDEDSNTILIDLPGGGGWQCIGDFPADNGRLVLVIGEAYLVGGDNDQFAVVWMEADGTVIEQTPIFHWTGTGSSDYAIRQSFIYPDGHNFGACVKNVDGTDQTYRINLWTKILE